MNNNDLPARARAQRKLLRMTQEQVAERAKVSLRAYQMFETGKAMLQPANLRNVLEALDLQAEDDAVAEATRSEWPLEVQVFLDVMGTYLTTMPEAQRIATIHELTRRIFEDRSSGR